MPTLPNHLIKKLVVISSNSEGLDKENLDFQALILCFVALLQRKEAKKHKHAEELPCVGASLNDFPLWGASNDFKGGCNEGAGG